MLHLISQSPIEASVLQRINSADTVVFLENAVLRILQNSDISSLLTQQLSGAHFYVLADDIAVRGISADQLLKSCKAIDYAELVELTVTNAIIQSWTP